MWKELLVLNVNKTKEIVFNFQKNIQSVQPVKINDMSVEVVNEYKYLGTVIDIAS